MARRVVAANIGVALVLRVPYSEMARRRIVSWLENGDALYVPFLWQYEVISALHKAVVAGALPPEHLFAAVDAIFSLELEDVMPSLETHRLALAWAERLKPGAAYDAQYLALAEQLGAEFWTADGRLVQRARQLGVVWVRHVEDDDS